MSARVHPGETCASWAMHGFLEFICGPHPETRDPKPVLTVYILTVNTLTVYIWHFGGALLAVHTWHPREMHMAPGRDVRLLGHARLPRIHLRSAPNLDCTYMAIGGINSIYMALRGIGSTYMALGGRYIDRTYMAPGRDVRLLGHARIPRIHLRSAPDRIYMALRGIDSIYMALYRQSIYGTRERRAPLGPCTDLSNSSVVRAEPRIDSIYMVLEGIDSKYIYGTRGALY